MFGVGKESVLPVKGRTETFGELSGCSWRHRLYAVTEIDRHRVREELYRGFAIDFVPTAAGERVESDFLKLLVAVSPENSIEVPTRKVRLEAT